MPDFPETPRATYRLQFNRDFKFGDAERVAPYLQRLGVSHVYASPYLRARAGSTHGYDITDHNALNPEIGDRAAFVSFSDALGRHGLGQILDFVPNHMGIGRDDNSWWLDVLEWGEHSPYAHHFDIDWQSAKLELRGKVLVPSLGDHYGRVLESGDLQLKFAAGEGTFSVWYFEHRFPINPGQYHRVLREVLHQYRRQRKAQSEVVVELEDLLVGFRDVGDWSPALRQPQARRAEADRLKQQLAALAAAAPSALSDSIEAALDVLNGTPGDPESFMWLHELLEAQHYRLAYWRVAAEEINYRRFFQINDLAGIRTELPTVFDAAHRLVIELIRERRLHGLRIDHVDGLFDPKQYLQRLQQAALRALAERAAEAAAGAEQGAEGVAGTADGGSADSSFYVIVEKILAPHERLRDDWPIAGTTGYEFLNRVHGLFVDPGGEAALQRLYDRFTGGGPDFEEIAYDSKRQVMDFELASELRVLANEYNRLTESSWLTRDYTLVGLRQALREIVACFPVYRTYVSGEGASAEDRRDIDWAIAHARRRSVRADKTVFDFLQSALTTDIAGGPSAYNRREVRRLAMKFQQYTGPVAAKGVEDTAFYRFNRLISLNEVGGEPTRFGTSVAAFHRITQDTSRRWPQTMLATATHDSKRGEDARVRIDVLSETPAEWGRRVRRWATLTQRWKTMINEEVAPTANDEYLFYQAMVGSWPAEFHDGELDPAAVASFRDRLSGFVVKAAREAKVHSSWINPNAEYEGALTSLVARCLDVSRGNPFLSDFREFHRTIAVAGAVNALAQATLKLTAPGVPDIYQGCESWDFSLVDPDNRRPVDFEERERRLTQLSAAWDQQGGELLDGLLERWPDGVVKMFVIWRLLSLRRDRPTLFRDGGYAPVEATGTHEEHVCAFLREEASGRLLTVVPRLVLGLGRNGQRWPLGEAAWGDTALQLPPIEDGDAEWINAFTGLPVPVTSVDLVDGDGEGEGGARIALADAFRTFPMAVLVQRSGDPA